MPKNVYSESQLLVMNNFFDNKSQKPTAKQLDGLVAILKNIDGKKVTGPVQIKFWFTG